ncbi:pyridoxal 5'-phosphate synthase glutaminase subunit PdxT [Nocardioides bruguierae]|uniref:Pyridoxal 5'-phosphate synthase subunit PdxT n=1 Tax=Nocardioides bruguierae TaxID=2945102 RepID=A0A9X2IG76_9ACTN|nr:pyridoxal 5'-phosphate synthase glutaminase subunit PdxT [Nocardioides bruguierae]MCM0622087.1 pyridoxal 5'-phosphate synthase glutaminase subunit PdxT [Nocardioides bruguierae]
MPTSRPTLGVLALQGDVREHVTTLRRLDVDAITVRRPEELARCHGLVLPGGESTTMWRLARTFDLLEPLRERLRSGLPAFGTCAGMILLADRILDGAPGQETLGGIDMTVRRNAFGRQVDSFEGPVHVTGIDGPVHGVFIRAPWVEEAGPEVEVLAALDPVETAAAGVEAAAGRIVAVRQGHLMATSFHPEVGHDSRVHGLFVDLVLRA